MLCLRPQGWKHFSQASNFEVIYGGGESIVAGSLVNYSLPVDFLTRLLENDLGDCTLMEIRKKEWISNISPVLREDIAIVYNRNKVLWSPGCATLREIC